MHKNKDGGIYSGYTGPNLIHQELSDKGNKNDADPICRLSEKHIEAIDHVLPVCPITNNTIYTLNTIHDKIGLRFYWKMSIFKCYMLTHYL